MTLEEQIKKNDQLISIYERSKLINESSEDISLLQKDINNLKMQNAWLKELQAYRKAKAEIEERLKKHYASDVSNGLMLVNMIIDKHLKEGDEDDE